MILTCVRDCYGTPQTGLFVKGGQYDVDLSKPWVIHFETLPGAPPEDVKALAQAQRAEVARGKAELERKRAAKSAEDGMDEFSDMKLASE